MARTWGVLQTQIQVWRHGSVCGGEAECDLRAKTKAEVAAQWEFVPDALREQQPERCILMDSPNVRLPAVAI